MVQPKYNVDYYISKGLSSDEAAARVQYNKDTTRAAVEIVGIKRSMETYSLFDYLTIEQYTEIKRDNDKVKIAASTKVLVNLVTDVMGARGLSFYDSYWYIRDVIINHPSRRPLMREEIAKEVFGEDHPRYLNLKNKPNPLRDMRPFERFCSRNTFSTEEEARKAFKASLATNTVEYAMDKYNVSYEEAVEIISDRNARGTESRNNKPPEELARINKTKGLSLENCINKYGPDLGPIKYEYNISIRKGRTSLQYYKDLHGDEEGERIYYATKGNRSKIYYCLEYWLERGMNVEEATSHLQSLFDKRPSFSSELCIARYGYNKGLKIWRARQDLWQKSLTNKTPDEIAEINRRKSTSKEMYIEKHGEEEGSRLYDEKLVKWGAGRATSTFNSKEANAFLSKLYKKLRTIGVLEGRNEVYMGTKKVKEFFLVANGQIRFFDFTIPKLKVVVEYNGVAFHPRVGDYEWRNPHGKTYDEVVANDNLKRQMAEDKGYTVLYVWSDEDLDAALDRLSMEILEIMENKSA